VSDNSFLEIWSSLLSRKDTDQRVCVGVSLC